MRRCRHFVLGRLRKIAESLTPAQTNTQGGLKRTNMLFTQSH